MTIREPITCIIVTNSAHRDRYRRSFHRKNRFASNDFDLSRCDSTLWASSAGFWTTSPQNFSRTDYRWLSFTHFVVMTAAKKGNEIEMIFPASNLKRLVFHLPSCFIPAVYGALWSPRRDDEILSSRLQVGKSIWKCDVQFAFNVATRVKREKMQERRNRNSPVPTYR